MALHSRFASAPAGVRSSRTVDASVRLCEKLDLLSDEVWPALPAGLRDVACKLDALRAELTSSTGRALLEDAELQLLTYEPNGFYARHVDDGLGTGAALRRSISLLLYLTPDDWRNDADGGQLRVHAVDGECARVHRVRSDGSSDELISDSRLDIVPQAGMLVLFDSASVPHEVRPTQRQRSVVVGWLLERFK